MKEKEETKNRNSIKYIEKSKQGITLVALVVTIVVLLILAGVTITALLGDDGIIKKAQNAADGTNLAVQNELTGMNSLTDKMNSILNGSGGGENIDPETGWNLDKVTKVESDDKIIVPVPIGYTASSATGENRVNDGFVIYEGTEAVNDSNVDTAKTSRNQFVWIPVDDISQIANQTSGVDANGRQNYQGKLYDFSTSGATEMTNYGQGTTSCREPDIVIDYDGSDATDDSSYFISAIGNISGTEFKTQLQEEFNEMIESVETYGGFYIGRYETGNLAEDTSTEPVIQKGNNSISSVNWYYMYQNSKKVGANNNVASTMIWRCMWDRTLIWLTETGEKTYSDLTDSRSWGNYGDSTGAAATYSGNKQPTGRNEAWKANNIYDLAGNVWDWTLEADNTGSRVIRRWHLLRRFWFRQSSFFPQQRQSAPRRFRLSVPVPHFM